MLTHAQRLVAFVIVGIALLGGLAGSVRGQCAGEWIPSGPFPGVHGEVFASIVWDPDGAGPEPAWLVVGGDFPFAGTVASPMIAAWDGVQWRGMAGLEGPVRALAIHDGQLCAAVNYGNFGAMTRVVAWNGSEWDQFGSPWSGAAYDMLSWNGQLVVGGFFTSGEHLRGWDGNTWQSLGNFTYGYVTSLASYGGDLWVGGRFIDVNGVSSTRGLARYDGGWHSVWGAAPFSGDVWDLRVFGGELIVVGEFSSAGGIAAQNIARWNGAAWAGLGAGVPSASVPTLGTFEGRLLVGSLTTAVRAWDGSDWSALPGIGAARTLTEYQGRLILGGSFEHFARNIAAWDGAAWHSLGNGFDGMVRALQEWNGRLFAAGYFLNTPSGRIAELAQFDGNQWMPVGAGPGFSVASMAVYQGQLVARGPGGVSVWDGQVWTSIWPGPSGPGEMVVWDGRLAMGNGSTLRLWDGANWTVYADPSGLGISALGVCNGDLYAGMTDPNWSIWESWPARWTGSYWEFVGGLFPSIRAIAEFQGDCYFGGDEFLFKHQAGSPPVYVGPFHGAVRHLRPRNGVLLAAGDFTTPVPRIGAWDGTVWHQLGGGLPGPYFVGYGINDTEEFQGELWVGGAFTIVGSQPAPNLARWRCACYANCDNSTAAPVLNVADFACFLSRFAAGDPWANCDQSTIPPVLNVADFACFLQAFAAGCP